MDQAQHLDITAIEDLIRQSMSDAKSQGIIIIPSRSPGGTYYLNIAYQKDGTPFARGQRTCPLGTVALQTPAHMHVIDRLGVDSAWVAAFTRGFDRYPAPARTLPKWQAAYDLGTKLRHEWEQGDWGSLYDVPTNLAETADHINTGALDSDETTVRAEVR